MDHPVDCYVLPCCFVKKNEGKNKQAAKSRKAPSLEPIVRLLNTFLSFSYFVNKKEKQQVTLIICKKVHNRVTVDDQI
jgi:hypothetical protein